MGIGVAKASIKTTVGTKTCVVDHATEIEADAVCNALNTKLLGARIIQSGGAMRESKAKSSAMDMLRDPNSVLSRVLLFAQLAGLIVGCVLERQETMVEFSVYPFLVTVGLGHSLVKQALRSAAALRISIQLLMGLVLIGALVLQKWREAATVSLLVCGSEWLLGRVNLQVEEAMSKTFVGAATHATKLQGTAQRAVKISDVKPGDILLLRSGEVVPVDGKVLRGDALMIDESSVTGEAVPLGKDKGAPVSSGTVVVGGAGEIECTATQENSFQGRMQSAVDDARNSQSETEELVNRIAAWYTPIVVLVSVVVALASGQPERGLATLVSACPCALVAAAPAAQACTLVKLLTDLQILVKNTKGLENMARLGAIAVDKTGTLTEGSFALAGTKVLPGAEGATRESLLRLLAAVESQDPHPLASCLVKAHVHAAGFTTEEGTGCVGEFQEASMLPKISQFTRVESMGVYGMVEGKKIGAGNAGYLESQGMVVPEEAMAYRRVLEEQGTAFTTVYMSVGDKVAMVVCLEDEVRADAGQAMSQLQALGVQPALLTGDSERPAQAVAKKVGISEVHASCKPMDKETWVRERRWVNGSQTRVGVSVQDAEKGMAQPLLDGGGRPVGRRCCKSMVVVGMLGDGLNDGPALAAADVGIAVSAGLQLTLDAADVVVNKGDHMLTRLSLAVSTAQSCHIIVQQNLCLAALIKGLAIVLAACGIITLSTGVLSDTASFLVVLVNSLRPLRWDLAKTIASSAPAKPPAAA